jgi:hypothetical protein
VEAVADLVLHDGDVTLRRCLICRQEATDRKAAAK